MGIDAAEVGDPQSLNLYSYVLNDPVNYVDPSGMNLAAPGGNGSTYCWFVSDIETRQLVGWHCMTIPNPGEGGEIGGGGSGGGNRDTTPSDKIHGDIPNCDDLGIVTFDKKGNVDPNSAKKLCEKIGEMMVRLTKSITQRFVELDRSTGKSYDTHRERIANEKRNLNRCIQKFDNNDCNDRGPRLPVGFDYSWARDTASRNVPGYKSAKDGFFKGGGYIPVIVGGASVAILAGAAAAAVTVVKVAQAIVK